MQENKFNQNAYVYQYKKEHYSIFKVELKKEEKKEIDDLLKKLNIKKVDFLKNAIKNLKEDLKLKKFYVLASTGTFIKSKETESGWMPDGDAIMGHIDCDKIFDNLDEATKFYDSIRLTDEISNNGLTRYSDYKQLYEISSKIEDLDDIDLNLAKLIKDDYSFVA